MFVFGIIKKGNLSHILGTIYKLYVNREFMENRTNGLSKKKLQSIAQLSYEKQELEKKYMLVSSKLMHLKNGLKNLNHDLRSPLSGITGMIDLMLEDSKNQLEVNASDLIMIRDSAKSILDLINGTLLNLNFQKKPGPNMIKDGMLSSVLQEINQLYQPVAQNKGIRLSLSTPSDTDVSFSPKFYINLIQITGNLVANAIKFTHTNGFVEVVFTPVADGNQNSLNVTVVDNGKSMTPDQVSAFNQGQTVARSLGTNGEQSYGIGLQHVRELVVDDGGHILVKSELNSGTTFTLSLPLKDNFLDKMKGFLPITNNGAMQLNGF